jgi:DNA-binding transcriptional ArsR family regulator
MPNQTRSDPAVLIAVFRALSDATRLAVVERLSIGPASVTELARPFDMALPSFMQHLDVLSAAGVVSSHKSGRTRVFQLAPEGLAQAARWMATHRNHWERRLDQLDHLLTTNTDSPKEHS